MLELHTSTVNNVATLNRAQLRDVAGRRYPLETVVTRIGRLADNSVVIDDPNVSRYHATIIDTGSSFVIGELWSGNGVVVAGQRVRSSAMLFDGDVIGIAAHMFTFEIAPAAQT